MTALTPEQQEIRATALRRAAQILADTWSYCARLTPEQQAREAYVPGGPSVAELTDRIRAKRAAAQHRAAA